MLSSACYIRGENHGTPTVREGVSLASRKTTTPQDKARSTVGKVAGKSASSNSKPGKGASPLAKAVTERVLAAAANAKSAITSAVKKSAAKAKPAAAAKAKPAA